MTRVSNPHVRRLPLPAVVPVAALVWLIAIGPLQAQETAKSPVKETWIGLYLNGRKMGYSVLRSSQSTYHEKPAIKIESTSKVSVEMLGNKVSQDSFTVTYTDSTGKPLYQDYKISSNGSAILLKADYQPNKVVCEVNTGGSVSKKEVPIPAGANIALDAENVTQGQKVAVGQKNTYYYLNPLTISLDKTEVEVLAAEKVTLEGKTYDAFRVAATSPLGRMTTWSTTDGEVLKGEMPLGMAMYRESKERAQKADTGAPTFIVAGGGAEAKSAYQPPADFAVATAITTDKPLPLDPRKVKSLSLIVGGLENKSLVLPSDHRQQAAPVPDKVSAYKVSVKAQTFTAADSVKLPIKEASVQAYLHRAPYLETDDPQIQATAKALSQNQTNAYLIATKICNWVHEHMQPDYTIGVPRSCSDVYKRKKGVCRDYATLFAGIARAAGIPTRVVGGIVYAEGKFYYHAWAECWLGDWVAFDPTMGNRLVDATHIKFAQGDVTDMYNVAGIVGRLKVNVLEAH